MLEAFLMICLESGYLGELLFLQQYLLYFLNAIFIFQIIFVTMGHFPV